MSYLKCVPNSGGQIPRDFLTGGSLGHESREAGHGAVVCRRLEEQGLLPRRGVSSAHGNFPPSCLHFHMASEAEAELQGAGGRGGPGALSLREKICSILSMLFLTFSWFLAFPFL